MIQRRPKLPIAIVTVLCAALAVCAETADRGPFDPSLNFHKWGAVTIFNGMPSDTVRAIAETRDGMFWFGTDKGLARFDGRRIHLVPLENSARVTSLAAAGDGALWIGTENGAFRLAGGAPEPIEPTRGFLIADILIDRIVYFATDQGIVLSYDNGLMRQLPPAPVLGADGRPIRLNSISRIGNGIVIGSAGNGLFELEEDELAAVGGQDRNPSVSSVVPGAGGVFVGSDAKNATPGIGYGPDVRTIQKLPVASGAVTSIVTAADGTVWAATERNGIYRFAPDRSFDHLTFENTAGGLRSNKVLTLFTDREGVIWAGTDRGACRFDPASPTAVRFGDDPNSSFVRDILPWPNGGVYVATNRGLFFLLGQNVSEERRWAGKQVYGLVWSEIPGLMTVTPAGVFEAASGRSIVKGDARSAIAFGNLIIAATIDRGLVADAPETRLPSVPSPISLQNSAGVVWIGTAGDGVFSYDGYQLNAAEQFAALRGTVVRKIVPVNELKTYFACENGLYVYENGAMTTLLRDAVVRDVVAVGNDLWVATVGDGLIHIREDQDLGRLYARLGTENGIPSDQVFAVRAVDGKVLVGTSRGLATYVPSDVPPAVGFSRVLSQRLHEADETRGTIELEYPQNSLLVEVSGMSSRTFPEQFQYAFVLKDSDGGVIERRVSSDAQFAPANLGAGEYIVEARAVGRDLGVSAPISLRFTVAGAPFPWTAAGLAALLTAALVALFWALIERRRLSVRNRELRDARFDLASEAERERSRIARDLHDQTLADLRHLMLMSDRLPTDTHDLRSEIETVSTEIRRICEDLSPSLLENVGLSAALEFLLHGAKPKFEFSAAPDIDERSGFDAPVQMQIFRIAQEIVSNIRQHSDAESIAMTARLVNGAFELAVRDRGQAFDLDSGRKNGRGIANVRSRAELIDARVVWERVGEENVFRLTKPLTVDIHE